MIKKTFKEIKEINDQLGIVFSSQENIASTKFGYAIKRFSEKSLAPIFSDYNDELTLARINNALSDKETDALLTDEKNPRGFKYSKEGLANVIAEEKKIILVWDEKEFELAPYISIEKPDYLTDEQVELFTGILI